MNPEAQIRPAPLVALTGASGFLGGRIAVALAEAGARLRVLVRRPEAAPPAAETVVGDLDDGGALARLAQGADVVVHCAGRVKAPSRAVFFAVNVDGTRRLAERVETRMVLVSSLAARAPDLSDYAASKAAAEAAAREVLGAQACIVRPPAIYGPGDRATLDLFRAAASSPVLPIPRARNARLALAFVDDVASAIRDLALGDPGPGPFAVGGARPEGYAWREIAAALASAAGRRPLIVEAPPAVLLAAGALSDMLARIGGAEAMFGSGKAREMLHPDWSVDPADEAPGVRTAPIGLEAGFARTLTWYRSHGWLT